MIISRGTSTIDTDSRAARRGTSCITAEARVPAWKTSTFARVAGYLAADGGAGGAALAAPEPVGAGGVVACRAGVFLAAEYFGDCRGLGYPD